MSDEIGRRSHFRPALVGSCWSPASDPVTSVLILPIIFEPFDRTRRQILGSGRLAETKRNRGVTRSARPGAQYKGISIMKIVTIVTAGLVAMLSVAAAADLPRREPPPPAAAPIGKYPVGKYPVGKYPQPVVTKG
jgi:hypothetical protein